MQSHDEYEISFPPGSMGLELEPVIKSSERELGCRVKDFYFGEDYDGIQPDKLQDMVHVGDIICNVNDLGVKSLPFVEVVNQLRNLKNQSRIVRFKDIAASWSRSATLTLTTNTVHSPQKQATTIIKNSESKSKRHNIPQSDENVANQLQLPIHLTSPKRLSTTATTPRKFGTERKNNNKIPGLQQAQVIDDYPVEEMALQSPITPSAIRKSNKKKTNKDTKKETNKELQPVPFMLPPSVTSNNVGQQLSEAGLKLGEKAVEVTLTASSMLVMNAHEAITTAAKVIPRYSLYEMQSIEHKKNQLLHELSQSVYELRSAEAAETQIEALLLRQQALETQVTVLQAQSKEGQEQLVLVRSHCAHLEAELASMCTQNKALHHSNSDLQAYERQQEEQEVLHNQRSKELQAIIDKLQQVNLALEAEANKVDTLTNEIAVLKLAKESHNRALEALQISTESLRNSLLNKGEEVDILASQLQESRHRLQLAETACKALENELAATGKSLSESQHTLLLSTLTQQSTEAQLTQKCLELEHLHSQLQHATCAIETQSSALGNYKEEGGLLEDKVHILELTVSAQQTELINNQTEVQEYQQRIATQTAEKAKLKETLQLHFQDVQNQVKQLRAQHENMIPEFYMQFDSFASFLQANIVPMVTTLIERVTAAEERANSAEEKLKISLDKLEKSEDEVSQLTNEVASLQAAIKAKEELLTQAQLDFSSLEASHQVELEQTCNIFTRQVTLLEENMQTLRLQSENKVVSFLQSIESIETQRSAELSSLQLVNCELIKEKAAILQEKTVFETRLLESQAEKEHWKVNADSACEDLLKTRKQLQESLLHIHELEQQLTAVQEKNIAFEREKATLKQQNSTLKQQNAYESEQQKAALFLSEKTLKSQVSNLQQLLSSTQMTVYTHMQTMRTGMRELKQDCQAKDDLHGTMIKSLSAQVNDLTLRNKAQTERIAELSSSLRTVEKTARENEHTLIQRIFTTERALTEAQRLQHDAEDSVQAQIGKTKTVEESLLQVSADLQRSRTQVQTLEAALCTHERAQGGLQGDYALLCQQLTTTKQHFMTMLDEQRKQYIQEQDELIDQLAVKERQLRCLQTVLVDIYRSLHPSDDRCIVPEDLAVKLPQLLQEAQQLHSRQHECVVTTLRLQLEGVRQEIVSLTQTNTKLSAQAAALEEARTRLLPLEPANNDKTVIAELQAQVQEIQARLVHVSEEKRDQMHTIITEHSSTIALLQQQHEDALTTLKQQLQATENEACELRQEIVTLTQVLVSQAAAATQEQSRLQLEQTVTAASVAELQAQVHELQGQMRTAIAEHNSTLSLLQREHETILASFKQAALGKEQTLCQEIASLSQTKIKLSAQLQEAAATYQAEQARYEAAIVELQTQVQELRQQLLLLKEEHHEGELEREAQMRIPVAEHNSTIALLQREHETALSSLTQTNTKLSQQLLEVSVHAGELDQALHDAQHMIEGLQAQQIAHEHAVKNNVHAQQIELKQLYTSLAVLQTRANEAEQEIANLSTGLQVSQAQLHAAHEALKEKDSMIARLQTVEKEVEEQLLALTTRNESLLQDYHTRCLEIRTAKETTATQAHDQIDSLREAMLTMEQALTLADDREQEIRTVLAQQRMQHQDQITHYRTAVEHAQRTAQLAAQGLQRKQRELDSLLMHVTELLKTTQSPVKGKPPSPTSGHASISSASPALSSANNKENSSATALQTSALQTQPAHHDDNNEFVVGEENEWHDTLLLQSLSLHEALSFTGLTLLHSNKADSSSCKLQGLFTAVTEAHHKLHYLLVRPPWVSPLSGAIPSLSPAFSGLSVVFNSRTLSEPVALEKAAVAVDERGRGYREYEEQFAMLTSRLKTLEASSSPAVADSQAAGAQRLLQLEAQDTVIIHDEQQDDERVLQSPISAEKVSFYISPLRSVERSAQAGNTSNGSDQSKKKQMPKALVFTSPMTMSIDDSLLVSDDGFDDDDDDEDGDDDDEMLRRLVMDENNQGMSFDESLLDFELQKTELV